MKTKKRNKSPLLVDVQYPGSKKVYTFATPARAAAKLDVSPAVIFGSLGWGHTLRSGKLAGYTVRKSKYTSTEPVRRQMAYRNGMDAMDRREYLIGIYNDRIKEYVVRRMPTARFSPILEGILKGTIKTYEEVVSAIPVLSGSQDGIVFISTDE